MKLKIRNKIIIMNIAVVILVLIIIYSITLDTLYQNMVQSSLNFLKKESYNSQLYIMNYIEKDNTLDVENVMKNMSPFLATYLSNNVKCRTQIYDKGGSLIGDSSDSVNFQQGKDVENAISGNKTYFLEKIDNEKYILFASPIYNGNETIGCIRYIYPLTNETSIVNNTFLVMIFIGLIGIIIALIFSYLFSNSIVKPIINLKVAASKVSEGNFTRVIKIESDDEVEDLADAFNKMSDNISKYVDRLKNEKEKQKRFLDNATHEFKTPLTAIIGFSDLLNRVKNKEDIEKCAYYIQKESKRLLNLVEELLKLSKIGKEEFQVNISKVNIKYVIEECLTILKLRFDKYSINISKNIFNQEILIDSSKTEEVILNIMDNAIKHSECKNIFIKFIKENEYFELSIRDDGKGIYKESLKNIFEPFCSIGKISAKQTNGTGLGLSICRQIMKKQNGTINIKSFEGLGTEVILNFKLLQL